jgi:hypothetical protein
MTTCTLIRPLSGALLALRLPEGDRVEVDAGSSLILEALVAGQTPAEVASLLAEAQQISAAEAEEHVASVLTAVGDGRPIAAALVPAFLSPGWNPTPYRQPELDFLPPRDLWLMLVAACATRDAAEAAAREWLQIGSETNAPDTLRLQPMAQANLRSHGVPLTLPAADAMSRSAWIKSEFNLAAATSVLSAFTQAGIAVVLHKGAAAALHDYCDPALRPMNDLDLVVPVTDRNRALDLMLSLGFELLPNQVDRSLLRYTHALALVRQHDRLNIDLHWSVLWTNCWEDADDVFWRTSELCWLWGVPCRLANPALRLLILCVHGMRVQDTVRHDWVCDAAMLLTRHCDRLDWDLLCRETKARSVSQTMYAALDYLRTQVGAPIPSKVFDTLRAIKTTAFERERFRQSQLLASWHPGLRNTFLHFVAVYTCFHRRLTLPALADFTRFYCHIPGSRWPLLAFARRVVRHILLALNPGNPGPRPNK